MPIAAATTSYPLLNIFWTMFEFFAWVAWIWLVIYVCMDIFRSHDLSGGAKALWLLFVFFIPVIGLLVYLIARGGDMHERTQQRVPRQYGDARSSYAPAPPAASAASAAPGTTADQLQDLADARDRGTISPQEFEREKAKILS
jgi:Phospholipase_D-nuclease N-terminal/Short C-terminal domain